MRRIARFRRVICLTFDDGPGEFLTERLLDLLAAYNARGTFYLLGKRVDEHPRIARRLADSEHQLGSHSHEHLNAWTSLPWKVFDDIRQGFHTVEKLRSRRLAFRPPYGKVTLASILQVLFGRRPIEWWTHNSGDTWSSLPEIERVVGQLDRDGGGVILLHDSDQQRSEDRVRYVLEFTEAVLRLAQARQYRVITVSEL